MDEVIDAIASDADRYAAQPMLARTHGQPASPTTLGKELANFAFRLASHRNAVSNAPLLGKFNGAVGNFNAHTVGYPEVDWPSFACSFVEDSLGLIWNPYTTQIEPHDYLSNLFDATSRYCNTLMGFNRDMWMYILQGYFVQEAKKDEVG